MSGGSRVVEVTAERLATDGRGIAIWEERELLVADLLPGERARVAIEHDSPNHPRSWGRIVERLGAPSPRRRQPDCPAFGRCGGCAWQHLTYAAQLEQKQKRVTDALANLGCDVPPLVPSPRPTAYRNRASYVVFGRGETLSLGAYQPRTHNVIETLGCQAVEPAVDSAARTVRDALAATGEPAYDERSRTGLWRYVVIRANATGDRLAALVTRSDAPTAPIENAAKAIQKQRITVVWIPNDDTAGKILGSEEQAVAGAGTIGEIVSGVHVQIGAGSFLQVNRGQAERLYQTIADWAPTTESTLGVELYSGLGGIAFALARRGGRVIGIERDRAAAAAANAAATAAGLSSVTFEAGDATRLEHGDGTLRQADYVVVDPPRKGLGPELCGQIVAARVPTLLYASCSPESFAADAARLASAGYEIRRVALFDMMPGTPEVELLAELTLPAAPS